MLFLNIQTGYFCPGTVHRLNQNVSTKCTVPGIIQWPLFYDGKMTYETSEVVSWEINFEKYEVNVSGNSTLLICFHIQQNEINCLIKV